MIILLVDDDPDVRESIKGALELRGHEVLEAETSWNAYQRISQDYFDAAIVDYNLGLGQDTGPNILWAIKDRYPNVPTCLYSGLQRGDCEHADVQINKSDPFALLNWIEGLA